MLFRSGVRGNDDLRLDERDLAERVRRGEVTLLDVRPSIEFDNGHLPGAISIPIEDLADRLHEIPERRLVVTYCRGAYCLFAGEAVEMLRSHGFDAVRLDGGWSEWSTDSR